MSTEVVVVYQDCVMCGTRGRQIIADFAEKGVAIRKVSFVSPEGRELCHKAVNLGIKMMPFYTDGETFTVNIDDLLSTKQDKKLAIKNKNGRKEKKNGAISKNKR